MKSTSWSFTDFTMFFLTEQQEPVKVQPQKHYVTQYIHSYIIKGAKPEYIEMPPQSSHDTLLNFEMEFHETN